jgi:hypothetical protein
LDGGAGAGPGAGAGGGGAEGEGAGVDPGGGVACPDAPPKLGSPRLICVTPSSGEGSSVLHAPRRRVSVNSPLVRKCIQGVVLRSRRDEARRKAVRPSRIVAKRVPTRLLAPFEGRHIRIGKPAIRLGLDLRFAAELSDIATSRFGSANPLRRLQ